MRNWNEYIYKENKHLKIYDTFKIYPHDRI